MNKNIFILFPALLLLSSCVNPSISTPEEEKQTAFELLQEVAAKHLKYNGDQSLVRDDYIVYTVEALDKEGNVIDVEGLPAPVAMGNREIVVYEQENHLYSSRNYSLDENAEELTFNEEPSSMEYVLKEGEKHIFYDFYKESGDVINTVRANECSEDYAFNLFFSYIADNYAFKASSYGSAEEYLAEALLYNFDGIELPAGTTFTNTIKASEVDGVNSLHLNTSAFDVERKEEYETIRGDISYDIVISFNKASIISTSISFTTTSLLVDPDPVGHPNMDARETMKFQTVFTFDVARTSINLEEKYSDIIDSMHFDYETIEKIRVDISLIVDGLYLYGGLYTYDTPMEDILTSEDYLEILGHSSVEHFYLDEECTVLFEETKVPCTKRLFLYSSSTPDEGYAVILVYFDIVVGEHNSYSHQYRTDVAIDTPYVISFSSDDTQGLWGDFLGLTYTKVIFDGEEINEDNKERNLESKVYRSYYEYRPSESVS